MTDCNEKRNVSIEVLRIVGCVLVIWAHMQLSIIENGRLYTERLFVSSLIADDVPIFLIISGFFLFRGGIDHILIVFKNRLVGFFRKIWIPSVILVVITCFLTPIMNRNVFWNNVGMLWEQIDWSELTGFILKNQASGYAGHLWYVCFYFKLMFFLPVLALLCQDMKTLNIIRRIYLGISFVNFFIEDMSYFTGGNKMVDLSSVSMDHDFAYIILGFELYLFCQKIGKWSGKRIMIFAGSVYFIGVATKMGLQALLWHVVGSDAESRFMWKECLVCYMTSAALLLLFSNIRWKVPQKIENVILFIANKTMLIYLYHMIVLHGTSQFRETLLGILNYATTPLTAILYYVIAGGLIFCIGLIIAIAFDFIYEKICGMLSRIIDTYARV